MSKHVATDWKVVVDGLDLSDHAYEIDTPQEKDAIDVSGFGGSREFVQGTETATLTVSFIGDFGSNSVHSKLETLYRTGSQFPVYVQPVRSSGTTSTNPLYGGTAQVFTYNGGPASLNDRLEVEAEFRPAPGATFRWGTTAI